MDHSKHTPLAATELDGATLSGATIYDSSDSSIGTVSHLHGSGTMAEVIIDVGGFLGMGAKPVALPVSQLNFMRDEDGVVHGVSPMSKDQLKELPAHHHHG